MVNCTVIAFLEMPCNPNPCLNGGTCTVNNESAQFFECECTEFFEGNMCEIPGQ